jgi:excisionase family DNA binding protein
MRQHERMQKQFNTTSSSDWLTVTEAARRGPFSKTTLLRFIAEKRLRVYRPLAKKSLIRACDLDHLIEECVS